MRADRPLQLLLILQTRGQATAKELAARLGVSTRTMQCDMEALSLSGVPIYAVRGRGGGWALLPGYRTQLTGMTAAEAMTVFVGTTAHVLADLGLAGSSDRAMTKLLAALPAPARRDAEYARARVLLDDPGWNDPAATPKWLDACRQGLWDQRWLGMRYAAHERLVRVAPLGLVAKGRKWYLVARRGDSQIRTYRVARIARAEVTGEEFDRPPRFRSSCPLVGIVPRVPRGPTVVRRRPADQGRVDRAAAARAAAGSHRSRIGVLAGRGRFRESLGGAGFRARRLRRRRGAGTRLAAGRRPARGRARRAGSPRPVGSHRGSAAEIRATPSRSRRRQSARPPPRPRAART